MFRLTTGMRELLRQQESFDLGGIGIILLTGVVLALLIWAYESWRHR